MEIKTFCGKISCINSQDEVDIIDNNINEYIKRNKITYSDIKRFEITKLESHPNFSCGGDNSSWAGDESDLYLVYTLIIEKTE